MRVDLALFDGDTLLERQEILVTSTPKVERFGLFRASYKLGPDAAEVVLDDFASRVEVKHSTLTIPVHESSNWESIELDRYTLAFWCRLDT